MIEVLVSTAILALLVVLLSGVFTGVSNVWKQSHANIDRLENIRAVTDIISGELRSALLPVNRTDKGNLQFIKNPANIDQSLLNPDALFWQAPVAADSSLGDVAVIGYFVRWDNSTPPRQRPILCRVAISAKGKTGQDPNFLIYDHTPGTSDWLSDAIISSASPGDVANGYRGLISENVVAFFVECLDGRGRPITSSYAGGSFAGTSDGFDSRLGFTDASAATTRVPPNNRSAPSPLWSGWDLLSLTKNQPNAWALQK
ncbi:MAG: hypothetical protein ACOYNN_14120 [Terrimicrobiaceae bacterium]